MPQGQRSRPKPLFVTAHLASPLAESPPHLDALMEWAVSPFYLEKDPAALEPWKITRDRPAPPQGDLRIPILREWLGPWLVARCSSPVLGGATLETVEFIGKRLATEEASLLHPDERRVVTTTNSWTKSYRLPLRVRAATLVRWCCVGNAAEVRHLLKGRVKALSKKRADGYGRVARWEVEPAPADYSWYAPHPAGTLLMRTLPVGPWLPKDLIGYRPDFGGCVPPYWHSDRWCSMLTPT